MGVYQDREAKRNTPSCGEETWPVDSVIDLPVAKRVCASGVDNVFNFPTLVTILRVAESPGRKL